MARGLTLFLTLIAMLAFAGNSLLCRAALTATAIDPASFTAVRLLAGALTLWLIVGVRQRPGPVSGSWTSALALFTYAATFSYAYLSLSAATGTLLLFGAVQTTMIGYGLWSRERPSAWQSLGMVVAAAGLLGLLLPGLTAPPLIASVLMLAAGVAWGIYSLRGRGAVDPTCLTAGNFLRALPFAAALSLITWHRHSWDGAGVAYALASGALASGIGYAIWYRALPGLAATTAATVQLSVPVLAALGGILVLGEALSPRLIVTSVAILGGIALVTCNRPANR